jgi:SulP family sulfate permease
MKSELLDFPIIRPFREYQRQWLMSDLIAGFSVCVVMIPSVIAYAELAGLSPVHGLYAALLGMVAYAIFASSRHVITGPDAAVALLVGSVVGPMSGGDPSRAAALAAIIAMLCGGLLLLAAILRAGVIADLLSKPVMVGYLSGAALILISLQLGKLFGIRTAEHNFFPLIVEVIRRLGESHLPTLILGAGLIVILEVLRYFAPRLPGTLAVFVLSLVVSGLFDLAGHGVKVIGQMPIGFPAFHVPVVSLDDIGHLFPAAFGIVMLIISDGILLSRAFASKNHYLIRPNQELMALAAANLASGFFQGFSVGASQSRTTVNDAAGGKTQLVSLFAATTLAAFLLFFTPLLRFLPVVSIASILIFAGVHLIEVHQYRTLLKISPRAFLLSVLVGAGVLGFGIVPGILIGVLVSLFYLLSRLARPMDAVLQEVPGTARYHDLSEASAAQTVPGLIAYRFYSPLYFANAEYFVRRVRELIASSPSPVRWFVLDMQAVWDIDVTAADALSQLIDELRQQDITLAIARANRPLRENLERIGLKERFDETRYFTAVHLAVEAFLQQKNTLEGSKCPRAKL